MCPPNRERRLAPTFAADLTGELCLPVKNMEIEVESVPAPESSRHYWPQKRTEKAKSRREAMISRRWNSWLSSSVKASGLPYPRTRGKRKVIYEVEYIQMIGICCQKFRSVGVRDSHGEREKGPICVTFPELTEKFIPFHQGWKKIYCDVVFSIFISFF